MKSKRIALALSLFLVGTGVGVSFVGVARRAYAEPHHHGPPPAAFEACKEKKPGDTCDVTLPDRTVSGTCNITPDDRLACRPDHPPGPPPASD